MKRPRVRMDCVAQHYAQPNECIIEFSSPSGAGGLIALREWEGLLVVDVYQTDDTVVVRHAEAGRVSIYREGELAAIVPSSEVVAWMAENCPQDAHGKLDTSGWSVVRELKP